MPRIPDDLRIYAIGDIHGRADLLAEMLAAIAADQRQRPALAETRLVFLGDYIDRGPASKQVVELLETRIPKGCRPIFLKGNHEDMLLKALISPAGLEIWLANGGEATLRSYGIHRHHASSSEIAEAFGTHWHFFDSLALTHEAGDYLFVHAGIRPNVALGAQRPNDLLWIRHDFLGHAGDLGRIVVHGHTPASEPEVRTNRIGIDTGAWMTGALTAIRLEGEDRAFLSTGR
ncbi:MAG: metallophosphoesterase family protein [Hyphomicrobiaceae bacterium]